LRQPIADPTIGVMSESKRTEVRGYLTKREQVILGMKLIGSRAAAQKSDGGREERRRKLEVFGSLGLDWVRQRVEEISEDPDRAGRRAFAAEEITDEKVPFETTKALVAWVLDDLDKIPRGDASDFALSVIEDRLVDIKAGNFKMPPELGATTAASGAPDGRPANGSSYAE